MSRMFDLVRESARGDPSNAETHNPSQIVPPPSEIGQNWESLETVRCQLHPESRVVSCSQNHNLAAEKFRLLRHRLVRLRQGRPLHKVLVTSAIPKEGKTVVAINLALTLARSASRVALVDADMRQPGVHRALGLELLAGFAEFLEGKLECNACIRRVDPLGLYYVPAGRASVNPFELLQAPRVREFMELMAAAFDWIILDSAPLIPFADTHCLATLTDTALLVARSGVTPRKALQQGLAALDGTHVAGVVFNASDDTRQDQYYYDYYDKAANKASG